MRLQRFEVQGYKNLRQRVVLEDLGAINVIHGENNVGKSNLLQAIGLFFRVLSHMSQQRLEVGAKRVWHCPVNEWNAIGFPATEIFDLEAPSRPAPIELGAQVLLDDEEVRELGIADETRHADIELHISRDFDRIAVRVPVVHLGEQDVPGGGLDEMAKGLVTLLSRRHLAQVDDIVDRFAFLSTDRRLWDERGEAARDLVPAHLLLQLYDARESMEPERYRRWELFTETMGRFSDILGKGSFIALFHRQPEPGRARLAWQTEHARIPVELMGSGVQQIVAIVARLMMSDATIVAIEEPELNLRFGLQRRLYERFEDITASDTGPRQIFLTSHSPAFESGAFFYGMRATPEGPVVERRPASEAPIFTEHALGDDVEVYMHARNAVPAWVSSDGVVQLSPRIRAELGIERGGGVVMWKRSAHPYVELLTDEQFLEDMRSHRRGEEEKGEGNDRE
jgi:AAA domain, putative AbiEii toxin, Type IV TA system